MFSRRRDDRRMARATVKDENVENEKMKIDEEKLNQQANLLAEW